MAARLFYVLRIGDKYLSQVIQESLANAKVSARHQCMYGGPEQRNLRQINARNILLKSTVHSVGYNAVADNLTIRVYLHSLSSCWLRNLPNPAKFSENSNL